MKTWKRGAILILPVLFAVCAYVNTHYKGFPKVDPPPAALTLSIVYGCVWTASVFLLKDSRGWLRFFTWYQGLALLMLPFALLCSDTTILPLLMFLGLMLPYLGFSCLKHAILFLSGMLLVQEFLSLYLLFRLKKRGRKAK